MRLNTVITLGASAAFGVMSIVLARGWINGAVEDQFRSSRSAAPASMPVQNVVATVPVLVADIDLSFGDEITQDGLRLIDMPEEFVPLGAFSDISDLYDPNNPDAILALGEIKANEVILPYKVSGQGERGSLSARIQSGYRAAAIRVDDVSGVAGFVVPGDLVDILYTYEPNPDAAVLTFRTDIILQSIKVLAVDQNLSDQGSNPNVARTVTVEVSHHDAQSVAAAMEGGTLSLSLRSVGETHVATTRPAISTQLAGRASPKRKTTRRMAVAPKPVKTFDPRTDIVVIRGDETSSVTVLSEDKQSQTELAGG